MDFLYTQPTICSIGLVGIISRNSRELEAPVAGTIGDILPPSHIMLLTFLSAPISKAAKYSPVF